MSVVLICSNRSLEGDLQKTVLFRSGIERETVRTIAEVQTRLTAGGIALLCLHRDVTGIEALVRTIRRSPTLKRTSILVLSENDFDPSEVEVLDAGANAILRLPPGDDFDDRAGRLIAIPSRRDVRLPVRLEMAALTSFGRAMPAVVVNLSASGALIESNHPLNMGDEVSITMRFDELKENFGAVAHITRTAGPSRYGARFSSITQGEEALKKFLASPARA